MPDPQEITEEEVEKPENIEELPDGEDEDEIDPVEVPDDLVEVGEAETITAEDEEEKE